MSENDAVKAIKNCILYLQQSHSIVCENAPKISRGSKKIIDTLSRIDTNDCKENDSSHEANDVVPINEESPLFDDRYDISEFLAIDEHIRNV